MAQEYIIDGSRINSLEDFYEQVSERLIPNTYWGRNLDAFNDILRGGFGTPDGGFVLRWTHSEISRVKLGYPETLRQLRGMLERCHPNNRGSVCDRIGQAERGECATVFDWLVEIIVAHGTGGEEAEDNVLLILG